VSVFSSTLQRSNSSFQASFSIELGGPDRHSVLATDLRLRNLARRWHCGQSLQKLKHFDHSCARKTSRKLCRTPQRCRLGIAASFFTMRGSSFHLNHFLTDL
jgi:hypothetical protein